MTWLLLIAATWLALAAVGALVIGRAMALADRRRPAATTARGNFVVDAASPLAS